MKKILTIIFILVFSVFVFGQDAQSVSTWQEFAPDGEEFSVNIPQKMIERTNLKEVGENEFNFISGDYRIYFEGVYYFIFSNKLNPLTSSIIELADPNLKSFMDEFDKEPENIKFNGIDSLKYEFKDSEDFYHIITFVKTNNRHYRFHTIQEESKNSNDDVKRFFNSIRLSNEISKPKTFEIKDQIFLLNNHNKFNIPNSESLKIESNENLANLVPMKITSKPRANYTDLARSYRLNGTVTFKATFSADGKIENIIPLKKMPFGLTNSVIEAIKGIKFEPEIRKGVPQSTTRMLNYSFEIF